jgi:hypothetical protein
MSQRLSSGNTNTGLLAIFKEESDRRVKVIASTQVCGAIAATITAASYCGRGGAFPDHIVFVSSLIAAAYLLGWAVYYWFHEGKLEGWLLHKALEPNPIDRDAMITKVCCTILIADALLGAFTVNATGGLFGGSIFAPLFFSLFGIAVMLRLPPRAWAVVLLTIFMIGISAELVYRSVPYLDGSIFHGEPWNNQLGRYIALRASTLSAVALPVAAGLQSFYDPIPSSLGSGICKQLKDLKVEGVSVVVNPEEQRDSLKRGMGYFLADAGRRVNSVTLSKVHDRTALEAQAVLLSLPYSERRMHTIRESIAYLVFVTHWIDDFFDDVADVTQLDSDKCNNAHSIFAESGKLKVLRNRVFRRLYRQEVHSRGVKISQWAIFLATFGRKGRRIGGAHRAIVDRAFYRLCLAGCLQRIPNINETKRVFDQYIKAVINHQGIEQSIIDIYRRLEADVDGKHRIIIWGTAKCLTDVFDASSMGSNVNTSELYSILCAPVLMLQNHIDEEREEVLSDEFQSWILEKPLSDKGTSARLETCIEIFRANVPVLRLESIEIRRGRRAQLAALIALYGHHLRDKLPGLYEEYLQLMNDTDFWRLVLADNRSLPMRKSHI